MDAGNITRINAAATVQIATGRVQLQRIIVSKTTTGTITIENSDGATSETINVYAIGTTPNHYDYGAIFSRGIRVTLSAADDVAIVYSST